MQPNRMSAVNDFHSARQRAALESIIARLRGRSSQLLSYDEVLRQLRSTGSADRGLREIPLDAIVGSVGRYTDFTRTFLPRHEADRDRWAAIKVMVQGQSIDALPPIEVYQIGQVYFVKDGNHRVSVARQEGYAYISAYVTEVHTRVPLTPDVQPDDLIIKAEFAEFLENTRLNEMRPDVDLSASVPGQYEKLEDHIEAHRYLKEVEQERELPLPDAAASWCDEVFLPIAQVIREQGILRYFAGRTETDLYVWIVEHRVALQRELGWQIEPEVAASRLAAQIKRQPQRRAQKVLNTGRLDPAMGRRAIGDWRREKIIDRYSDRLFADILVPLSGRPECWPALDQAIEIARRERARILGLYVVPTQAQVRSPEVETLRAEFQRRCEASGIPGSLGIEAGEITPRICERAIMSDLVVLRLAHPPSLQPLARLGSKIRAIIQNCVRPVLFVPGEASPLTRALLAYDGSDKAREALFVAAYLAERFGIPLVVVSVVESGHTSQEALDYARRYLEMHEAQADFVVTSGPAVETILHTAQERAADLTLIGGYGSSPVRQFLKGSSVEQVLRECRWPVLVCQ